VKPPGGSGWLTLGHAAKFLGVAPNTVRKWSDQGRLPTLITPGGHRRFREQDLEAFIKSSTPTNTPSRRPLVLVIEGDAHLREYLRVHLEVAGYEVHASESVDRVLVTTIDQPPHLVLIDSGTTGTDGWQLMLELEARHGLVRAVVYDSQRHAESELDAGGPDHGQLERPPFDPSALIAELTEAPAP
jgi:excisionase family DNA binding protein